MSPVVQPRPIILVDDDDMLRNAVQKALAARLSNAVLAFADGPAAVAWARENEPAAAVLDIDMDPMNGLELASALRELWPGLRVVFLTGSAVESVLADAAAMHPVTILNKPLGAEEIARVLAATV